MNRNLTASCFYCRQICDILEGMIESGDFDESEVLDLIDQWRESEHAGRFSKYIQEDDEE